MDLYIMNPKRETIGIIDNANSVIWTPRYINAGDFEISIGASVETVSLLREGNYVYRLDAPDMVGVIERISLKTDVENGDTLIVSGRDIKSLLARRIVWNRTVLTGNAENALRRLITENIISPELTERRIEGVVLGDSNGFSDKIDKQITGDNLLTAIVELCESLNYGLRGSLNESKQFVFQFYKGVDRSENQMVNPWVTFSPEFDNLLTSSYEFDTQNFRNVALVAGEGEGSSRKRETVGTAEGLERFETYVDARDLSTDEGAISETEYSAQLQQRGREKIAEFSTNEIFEGEVIEGYTYTFGTDYFLGDVVTVENEFGIKATVKITEIIESEDDTGHYLIPTFENFNLL